MGKTFKTSLAVAASTLMLVGATSVFADSHNDAVLDERGDIVVNTWNNCVVTKWSGGHGCHGLGKEHRTVYFEFNSSRLTAAAKSKLNALANGVKDADNIDSVTIVGFADMIGDANYNRNLSMRRANSVRSYLASQGVNVRASQVRAFGEDAPASQCGDLRGNALINCLWRDRRVEVELNYGY